MKIKRQLLVASIVVGAVLLVGLAVLLHTVPVSYAYGVESQFGELPKNDEALKSWLQGQPGVAKCTVGIERMGDGGKLVRIHFIQSRTPAGSPPFPDLDRACQLLGYRTPAFPFRDSRPPPR